MPGESIYEIIKENDFILLVRNSVDPFFRILNFITIGTVNLSKRYYSDLMNEAEELETFLDDYAASENRTWSYFRELVASIRNLAIAGFQIKHVVVRFPDYNIDSTDEERELFKSEADKTILFLNHSIHKLFKEMLVIGEQNGLKYSGRAIRAKRFREMSVKKHLPKTLKSNENIKNSQERIIELSRKYRKVWSIFRLENLWEKRDEEKLKNIVPIKIDEKKAQKLKNIIHNVQSDYDTYIKNTPLEAESPVLKKFRGHISIPLHLLESTRWLCHFFERHGDEIKNSEYNVKISNIVNKWELLERMSNFALFYSGWYLQKGNKLAEEILTSYVTNMQYELPIPKPLGFHARPATYVSMVVNEHGTDVFVLVNGDRFNTKSILHLMEAGGLIADLELKTVTFEGDKRVLDDLKILAEHNYCEDQEIPRELNYLRITRNIKESVDI